MVCGLLNIMLARHFSLLIVCVFCFFVNCTPCHAHLWGFLCPIFVVACVRGHLIVIVCVINNALVNFMPHPPTPGGDLTLLLVPTPGAIDSCQIH